MANYTITPVAQNLVNQYDYLGLLVGLTRLPEEKNAAYRKRLWDVYVHRASSTRDGLINGITRELGLAYFEPLQITSTSTNSPRVIVRDTQIELYSKWILDEYGDQDYTLDAIIDIYSSDSSELYIPGLITTIDALTWFGATAVDTVSTDTRSATLLEQDSRKWQEDEIIKPLYRINLEKTNIVSGTLTFSFEGRNVYANEVSLEASVTSVGTYWVDYANGFLVSYSLPSGTVSCRYMYDELPLILKASPVVLCEFGSSTFRSKIFEQVLKPDGINYEDGLPLHEATDTIQELISASPLLWGS